MKLCANYFRAFPMSYKRDLNKAAKGTESTPGQRRWREKDLVACNCPLAAIELIGPARGGCPPVLSTAAATRLGYCPGEGSVNLLTP